ncbi:P-loop containing nucleoside triphosphate hydrolase protein [Ramicandelaber brevisporus]|nr:P-loop containing nucleoside triphosphate hydrolase protein [Ramicandelaber brevisporus]
MESRITVACVGKPSAGKSSFLNAVTDASAKVGAFPFTTIEPNTAVAYYRTECPCKVHNLTAQCRPRYGRCEQGVRYVPFKMMDVAGLVPGASEGRGLGNRFLDDLRHANALIHVVDVSGTTDANGKETKGYDPINDIDWLLDEIHSWIFGNLHKKWGGIARRHVATKSTAVETIQAQLSGYGATQSIVQRTLDVAIIPLEKWDDDALHGLVDAFIKVRFPMVIALNKIDHPDSDRNIAKIMKKYTFHDRLVLTSALAECLLRKMTKQRFIDYSTGADDFVTAADTHAPEAQRSQLKTLDEKTHTRLENIRDLILFRYNSTGTQDVLQRAIDLLELVTVFPVRNINNFGGQSGKGVFRDCLLVPRGTTVREVARLLHLDNDRTTLSTETVGGRQLSEDHSVTSHGTILSFKSTSS